MSHLFYVLLFAFASFLVTPVTAQTKKPNTRGKQTAEVQYGTASFYADKFEGRSTASGEKYNKKKFTAAHNSLPMGTWIKVTNITNKKWVIVKVNDRLHHRNPRLVDLSKIAAQKLQYTGRGLTKVKVEVLGKHKPEDVQVATNK
jgi:rare lipoprotein A